MDGIHLIDKYWSREHLKQFLSNTYLFIHVRII